MVYSTGDLAHQELICASFSAQVETQLKTKIPKAPDSTKPAPQAKAPEQSTAAPLVFERANSIGIDINSQETMDGIFNSTSNTQDISPVPSMMTDINLGIDDPMSWEMIGLGLEEPLPMQEAIDDLLVDVIFYLLPY